MPFAVFNKYEEIPEALGRDNYRQGKDGKWYPQVTDDHPLVKKKNELLTTNTTLTADKVSLEGKVVPNGSRVVPLADFTLLENIKALGVPTDQIVTRIQKYPDLEKKEIEAARVTNYAEAAKFLKYPNVEAFSNTLKLAGVEVTFKDEAVAGSTDKVKVPYVGEVRLADHINNTPDLKTFEPFFKVQPQAQAPRTEAGAGSRPNTTQPAGAGSSAGSSSGAGGSQGGGNGGGEQPANTQTNQQQYAFQRPNDVTWPA